MTPVLWCLLSALAGGTVGFFVCAILTMGKRADEPELAMRGRFERTTWIATLDTHHREDGGGLLVALVANVDEHARN